MASLDPLARREFLQDLMEAVADQEISVVLSSHLVADLERVCDYLVVLAASRVQIAGDVDALIASHHRLIGPRRDPATLPGDQQVIQGTHTDRQSTLIIQLAPAGARPRLDRRAAQPRRPGAGVHEPGRQRPPQFPSRPGGAAMIWLTWRQFRTQAVAVSAALAAFAILLLVTGPHVVALARQSGFGTCHSNCGASASSFLNLVTADQLDKLVYILGAALIIVLPAVIGLFWGAPLIARELESGTFRLAWNQSVTRERWLAVKLGVLGLTSMALAGLLSLILGWWASPIDHAAGIGSTGGIEPRFFPLLFGARGIAPIGYAAFAFTLGVLIGLMVRRTVPAMAITLAVFAIVQIAVPLWIRPHLITPVTQHRAADRRQHQRARDEPERPDRGPCSRRLPACPAPGSTPTRSPRPPARRRSARSRRPARRCRRTVPRHASARSRRRTSSRWSSTSPPDRYWTFQWLELGIFLTVAILLAWACFWWVRRRLS